MTEETKNRDDTINRPDGSTYLEEKSVLRNGATPIVAGHDVSPKTWIEEVRDLADYLEDYRSRTFPNPARWSSLSTGVPR